MRIDSNVKFIPYCISVEALEEHEMICRVLSYWRISKGNIDKFAYKLEVAIAEVQQGAASATWNNVKEDEI